VELPTSACYPILQTAHSFHQQNPVVGGWECCCCCRHHHCWHYCCLFICSLL